MATREFTGASISISGRTVHVMCTCAQPCKANVDVFRGAVRQEHPVVPQGVGDRGTGLCVGLGVGDRVVLTKRVAVVPRPDAAGQVHAAWHDVGSEGVERIAGGGACRSGVRRGVGVAVYSGGRGDQAGECRPFERRAAVQGQKRPIWAGPGSQAATVASKLFWVSLARRAAAAGASHRLVSSRGSRSRSYNSP